MSTVASSNLLLKNVEYLIEETPMGVWRRFVYPDGRRFAEYKTHKKFGGLPLVHYTAGICPETGRRITAQGIIAVGRIANGVVAIGQLAVGLVAIGQLSIGVILGLGQATFAALGLGQLSLGILVGVGQVATGQIAVGQFAFGGYVLAQLGYGRHVIDMHGIDPAAKEFFLRLIGM